MCVLRALRQRVQRRGSQNIVYFDYRPHGWAPRGAKIFGKISRNNRKAANLIMAQRGREWLAPMLFEGNCTHHTVAAWIEQALLPELQPNRLVIMNNAPFHNKPQMRALFEARGHSIPPLPKNWPGFNPIGQSFAILKKRRVFSGGAIQNILASNY